MEQVYFITENLDDHNGYKGQPVVIVKGIFENYFLVQDALGNQWQVGEEELTKAKNFDLIELLLVPGHYLLWLENKSGAFISKDELPLWKPFLDAVKNGETIETQRQEIRFLEDKYRTLEDSTRNIIQGLNDKLVATEKEIERLNKRNKTVLEQTIECTSVCESNIVGGVEIGRAFIDLRGEIALLSIGVDIHQ